MKRQLVRVAIGLIVLNAALAIVILLSGDMGDTEGKILGTSALASATALLAMVQMPAVTDRRLGPIPLIAIVAAVVGFAIVTAGIWTEADSEAGWKTAGTAYTLAVAGGIAALLAGLRLRRATAWVRMATLWVVAVATAMVVVAIWAEVDSTGYWRLFGVVMVLLAAGGMATPILSRSAPSEDAGGSRITHCPYCGAEISPTTAKGITCPSCGRRFSVSLEDDPAAQN